MKNKLTFFAVLISVLIFFAGCTPKEEEKEKKEESPIEMKAIEMETAVMSMLEDMMTGGYILEAGKIISGNAKSNQLLIETAESGEKSELVLNIEKTTPAIDAVTGASAKKSEIKEGTEVYAWVSSAYASSLPPQTAAMVLFVNVKDRNNLPMFVDVSQVSEDEKGFTVTSAEGIKWFVEKNTETAMYESKEKIPAAALKAGSKALFWEAEKLYEAESASGTSKAEEVKQAVKILVVQK